MPIKAFFFLQTTHKKKKQAQANIGFININLGVGGISHDGPNAEKIHSM